MSISFFVTCLLELLVDASDMSGIYAPVAAQTGTHEILRFCVSPDAPTHVLLEAYQITRRGSESW